jgi:hypothetical protein
MHSPLSVKEATTIYSVVLMGDSITKIDLVCRVLLHVCGGQNRVLYVGLMHTCFEHHLHRTIFVTHNEYNIFTRIQKHKF